MTNPLTAHDLAIGHNARSNIRFTVIRDDQWFMVAEDSGTYSFMTIPLIRERNGEVARVTSSFHDASEAWEQVRRLHAYQSKGGTIRTRNIETPDRFEEVADTKFGCAW